MHIKKITQERVKKGKVLKINSTIAQINPKNLPVLERAISDFKEAQSSNTSSLLNCQETLFNNIRNMTDDSKSNALDLFDNMKYPKGRNQGKIISPHIQKKAIDFLNYGLYKKKSTIKDLEEENKELKSQIKKFGKEKEKLLKKTQSLGANPHPRIYTESGFKNLPNGRRAHEMPDKVTEWLSFLRDLKENFDIVFGQELLEALELLDSDEWGSFFLQMPGHYLLQDDK
ncbi:16501_t:CDS:2 [Entrophospora sp. SA101]|nr:16501_t:CDS:2 [Entrophospora sp. SA101]